MTETYLEINYNGQIYETIRAKDATPDVIKGLNDFIISIYSDDQDYIKIEKDSDIIFLGKELLKNSVLTIKTTNSN